jgi:hypothetical protein
MFELSIRVYVVIANTFLINTGMQHFIAIIIRSLGISHQVRTVNPFFFAFIV